MTEQPAKFDDLFRGDPPDRPTNRTHRPVGVDHHPSTASSTSTREQAHDMDGPKINQAPLTTVSVVARIDPFLMRTGVPFSGDVEALAEQMTRYVAENLSRQFTETHRDAGLFVAVAVKRGDESHGHEYREGHFVTQDRPATSPAAEIAALRDEIDRRRPCVTCQHRASVHNVGYSGCSRCDCGAFVEPKLAVE